MTKDTGAKIIWKIWEIPQVQRIYPEWTIRGNVLSIVLWERMLKGMREGNKDFDTDLSKLAIFTDDYYQNADSYMKQKGYVDYRIYKEKRKAKGIENFLPVSMQKAMDDIQCSATWLLSNGLCCLAGDLDFVGNLWTNNDSEYENHILGICTSLVETNKSLVKQLEATKLQNSDNEQQKQLPVFHCSLLLVRLVWIGG